METYAHTPSKRSTTLRDTLSPLIMQALPTRGPGMFPSEVAARLLRNSSQLPQSVNSENLETHVRIILKTKCELKDVSRAPAKGPNGGKSFTYVRCENSKHDSNVGVIECVPQLSPGMALDSRNRVEHSDDTHVGEPTSSYRKSSEAFQVAQNSQQGPAAESTTESDQLEHSFNTLESRHEQVGAGHFPHSTSEAHFWTHDNRDIVEKVLATKLLVAQFEKTTGEITVLETQQTQARSQYSDLDSQVREQEVAKASLLAEAQTWREQAAEAERKALSRQKDAERLKEEAENQKAVLEERTFRIASAREESTRLAERVRHAMEETVGGDLVNLLSLCTRDTS